MNHERGGKEKEIKIAMGEVDLPFDRYKRQAAMNKAPIKNNGNNLPENNIIISLFHSNIYVLRISNGLADKESKYSMLKSSGLPYVLLLNAWCELYQPALVRTHVPTDGAR
jgi:hypothetical protein